jgi:hypothetical protein
VITSEILCTLIPVIIREGSGTGILLSSSSEHAAKNRLATEINRASLMVGLSLFIETIIICEIAVQS